MKRATHRQRYSDKGKEISIHALVKRATTIAIGLIIAIAISIHALVKRATNAIINSNQNSDISIHALVKRATLSCFDLG